jgi:hypothetical protein
MLRAGMLIVSGMSLLIFGKNSIWGMGEIIQGDKSANNSTGYLLCD